MHTYMHTYMHIYMHTYMHIHTYIQAYSHNINTPVVFICLKSWRAKAFRRRRCGDSGEVRAEDILSRGIKLIQRSVTNNIISEYF